MRREDLHHHTHWWRNILLAIIVIAVVIFGGYHIFYYSQGVNKPQQSATSSVAKVSSTKHTSSKTSAAKATTDSKDKKKTTDDKYAWDTTKTQKLAIFMRSWEQTMGQQYVAGTPTRNVNYYGIQIPAGLSTMKITVNNQTADLQWSTDGKGSSYQIVAAYTNSATAPNMNAILYLFAFHDDKPIVLVTQTTNGDTLAFHATKNQALANGFKDIAAGKTPTTNNTNQSPASSSGSIAVNNATANTANSTSPAQNSTNSTYSVNNYQANSNSVAHSYYGNQATNNYAANGINR